MSKNNYERQKRYKQRKRDEGYEPHEAWVFPEVWEKVKKIIKRENEKAKKERLKNNNKKS